MKSQAIADCAKGCLNILKRDQFLSNEFITVSDDRRFKIDSSGYSPENISPRASAITPPLCNWVRFQLFASDPDGLKGEYDIHIDLLPLQRLWRMLFKAHQVPSTWPCFTPILLEKCLTAKYHLLIPKIILMAILIIDHH